VGTPPNFNHTPHKITHNLSEKFSVEKSRQTTHRGGGKAEAYESLAMGARKPGWGIGEAGLHPGAHH